MCQPFVNHIVLADDDRDHALLFERVLQQTDPTKSLLVAANGDELLALLDSVQPEILFLDLNMPCKNGLECLEEIRKDPRLRDLKVVVYSSSARMTDIQRSYMNEADLYMVKPFTSEHLKNALRLVLQKDMWEGKPLKNYYYINNRLVPFTASL